MGEKYIKPQEDKARHEDQSNKIRVTFPAKLLVGYWDLVPMESGADNSSEQGKATVTKKLEEPAEKQKCNLWWEE